MVVLYLLPSQWVPVLAPTPLLQLPAPDGGVRRQVREREQAITSAAVRIPFHTAMKRPARRTFTLLQKWRQNHPFSCVNGSLIIPYGLELSEIV